MPTPPFITREKAREIEALVRERVEKREGIMEEGDRAAIRAIATEPRYLPHMNPLPKEPTVGTFPKYNNILESESNMNIALVGDIHWDGEIFEKIDPSLVDMTIQVGDLGFLHMESQPINQSRLVVHFVDGNHDSIEMLRIASRNYTQPAQIYPNLIYLPRGHVALLGDSVVGFLGGGESLDRNRRTEGIDWFRNEGVSVSDLERLEKNLKKEGFNQLNVLIAHSPPSTTVRRHLGQGYEIFGSPNLIQRALEWFNPTRLFCGHIHKSMVDNVRGCRVRVLDINEVVYETF